MATTDHTARAMPRFPEFVALMASLLALTALAVDIMLPALDRIRDDLGVTIDNRQQLVVAGYMLGFALGQVIYGPLSDRFGRRPVLFAGLGLYIAASLACVFAGTLDELLLWRLVQGFGTAAPRVIAVAVVRDTFGGRKMAEVMSFVMMTFIIVPVIAPSVGGMVLLFGEWHAIFLVLGVAGALILGWTALRLPETRRPEDRAPLSPAWLGAALRRTATTRMTLGYTLATGMIFGALLAYVSSAQQIFTVVYELGDFFPVAFGVTAVGMAAASLVNGRFVGRLGMRRISHAALIGYLAAGLGMALAARLGTPPLALFMGLLILGLFCFGLIMPNFNAIAMEPMGQIAGTASSFVGAVTTAMAAVLGGWVGQRYDGSIVPLADAFAVFAAAGLVIVLVTERGRLFRVGN